jgi:hypothetical protein
MTLFFMAGLMLRSAFNETMKNTMERIKVNPDNLKKYYIIVVITIL